MKLAQHIFVIFETRGRNLAKTMPTYEKSPVDCVPLVKVTEKSISTKIFEFKSWNF